MVDISFNKEEIIFIGIFSGFLLITLLFIAFYPGEDRINSQYKSYLKEESSDTNIASSKAVNTAVKKQTKSKTSSGMFNES